MTNNKKPKNHPNQTDSTVQKEHDSDIIDENESQPVDSSTSTNDDSGSSENDAICNNFSGNSFIRQIINQNFIEYASYVIKERAIPDIDDGLKPVQRRILWALYRMDDGRFHKVANVIGQTMAFHPHGDASIGDALVVLANKNYFIDRQGNFGNILTGDIASAARYIECRLSHLARETLFNNDITTFIDSYDGRNLEPVRLPIKIPSLLMSGAEGIAVGMSTWIPPHNFCELLNAQIAILKGSPFAVYPDFQQGALMDVSEYDKGDGKLKLRAKIEREGRHLFIREIPPTVTTEKLIESIERAAEKNKIKVHQINDFTADKIEIEIIPSPKQDPEMLINALYSYTDCQISINTNFQVIQENRPLVVTVDQILQRNTEKLLQYLRLELEIELRKLVEKLHNRTLERIFIEERIYKKIEFAKNKEEANSAVLNDLNHFRSELKRDITNEDVENLLSIPIRRISLFDIDKNKEEIELTNQQIGSILEHLKKLKIFAIQYLKDLLTKYGKNYPRLTQITTFDKINKKAVALANIKVGWDRSGYYLGTNVKSDDRVICTEYDRLLCIEKSGKYRVIKIPEKLFVDKLYNVRKFDNNEGYAVVYIDKKSKKAYWKRFKIDKAVTDKEYQICPDHCQIELFKVRLNDVYELYVEGRKNEPIQLNLWEAPERSAKSRGVLIHNKPFKSLKFVGNENEVEINNYDLTQDEEPKELNENDEILNDNENENETALWKLSGSEMELINIIAKEAKEVAEQYASNGALPTIKENKPIHVADEGTQLAEPDSENQTDEESFEETESEDIPETQEPVNEANNPKTISKKTHSKNTDIKNSKKEEIELVTPQSKESVSDSSKKKKDKGDKDDWGVKQLEFDF